MPPASEVPLCIVCGHEIRKALGIGKAPHFGVGIFELADRLKPLPLNADERVSSAAQCEFHKPPIADILELILRRLVSSELSAVDMPGLC